MSEASPSSEQHVEDEGKASKEETGGSHHESESERGAEAGRLVTVIHLSAASSTSRRELSPRPDLPRRGSASWVSSQAAHARHRSIHPEMGWGLVTWATRRPHAAHSNGCAIVSVKCVVSLPLSSDNCPLRSQA